MKSSSTTAISPQECQNRRKLLTASNASQDTVDARVLQGSQGYHLIMSVVIILLDKFVKISF